MTIQPPTEQDFYDMRNSRDEALGKVIRLEMKNERLMNLLSDITATTYEQGQLVTAPASMMLELEARLIALREENAKLRASVSLETLESTANKNGATIYNICHRNAGWAIQWHETKRQGSSDNWKDGLVIYRYYATPEEMVKGELQRMEE